MIDDCIRFGTFRLLGIFWKEEITWWIDKSTGNIIIKYR